MTLSLVEVLMVKYPKDTAFYFDELKDFDIFSNGLDDFGQFVSNSDGNLVATENFVAFSFRCIGQNLDRSYSSGVEYEWFEIGTEEVFSHFINDLIEIGESILADKDSQGLDLQQFFDGRVVRFITVWNYESWRDSYYKEWDSECYLVGLLDTSKLESILLKEKSVSD